MRPWILLTFLISGCSFSGRAPYTEMTDRYEMPPEMRGCKVYILGGGYTDTHPLWVVVSPEGKIISSR